MFLLLLTGVGPLIAWRRSSFESLRKAFFWPTIGGIAVSAALFALGIRHFYALMSFALCAFVLITVGMEFGKGARAIASKTGQNLLMAMVELTTQHMLPWLHRARRHRHDVHRPTARLNKSW
jgi:cytochrome c-type biogenesis protein CcmF